MNRLILVRKRRPIPQFRVKEVRVGNLIKARVAVLYIDGVSNQENVNRALQRIKDIEYDQMIDSSYIPQIISNNANTPFQQVIDTERPDQVEALLGEGRVAIIVDGSPYAITVPTTLTEFFFMAFAATLFR